jgi:enediyne biosynthesis protein E4
MRTTLQTFVRAFPLFPVVFLMVGACTKTPSDTPCPDLTPLWSADAAGMFRDATAESGIQFTYRNGEEADHYTILEALGGGLAAIDFDGDGLLDLFVVGGGYFVGPNHQVVRGHPCRLYRNLGGGKFEDVTAGAGLDRLAVGRPWFYSHGAAVVDYDRDGWPDLLVTGWGDLALFHNEPVDPADPKKGRRFVDVTRRAGLPSGLWTTGAGWGDMDGDGFPDLYVCQYGDWSFDGNHPTNCRTDNGQRDICPPKRFAGLEHHLFRNQGDGTFQDVSKSSGLRVARTDADYDALDWLDGPARARLRQSVAGGSRFGRGLGVLFVDVNGDGRPDIYVTNDADDNFLYVNRTRQRGAIRLEEVGLQSGTALSADGIPDASMGADAADYNGTGRASLWCTNYAGEVHALYRNETKGDRPFFVHSSAAAGIAAASHPTVGWGTGFADLTHRGWEDLVLTAGDAYRNTPGIPNAQVPIIFENQGNGTFQDVTPRGGPYFRALHRGRGLVLADFDNDGRIDLAVSHLNEPIAILRNEADTGDRRWVGVELGRMGHADVVGAKVRLRSGGRTQTRFAKGGGSYFSTSDRRMVFGLGPTDQIEEITVSWPWGGEQHYRGLTAGRYWRLVEGREEPISVR